MTLLLCCCLFLISPFSSSNIRVTIEQNVTGDMVEITVVVNVSNKLNYVIPLLSAYNYYVMEFRAAIWLTD